MRKIAVIFPGIGYTKDRPLLYYSGKLARKNGYELIFIDYSEVDCDKDKIKDKSYVDKKLNEYLEMTEKSLRDVGDMTSDNVVFISKSLGTVVAASYARKKSLNVNQICFSPLEMIGDFINAEEGIFLYGDDDPFADYKIIEEIAEEKELNTFRVSGGNHSLETGDIDTDLENIRNIIQCVAIHGRL